VTTWAQKGSGRTGIDASAALGRCMAPASGVVLIGGSIPRWRSRSAIQEGPMRNLRGRWSSSGQFDTGRDAPKALPP
jgi:hypothetical protein